MSEKLASHESQEKLLSAPERQERLPAHAEKLESKQAKHERLQKARHAAHEQASSKNPLEALKSSEKAPAQAQPQHVNRELRQITLRRELQSIRRKLPARQRVLSRVVHQPVVRAVSEGVGRTASRPSGLLGGGIFAFLGTGGYYLLTRYMDYTYNNVVFFALFIGGFCVGLFLEFLTYFVTVVRRRQLD